jgi:light-regulated signal transduction histidine kinase (bacteriophytochrome)
MNDHADTLERQYSAALEMHLAGPSEVLLHAAYALGRTAAAGGLGVVDVAMLHNDTLQRVLTATGTAPSAAVIGKASRFLSECLAPYEMMLSGYSESNAKLIESNDRLHKTQAALENVNATLETVNKELEAFSYSVAHDLRAPLRSMLGFSSALLEDHTDRLDEEGRRFLRYVQEAARDMAQLIDDLLKLSRVVRGDLQRERVDVSDLARKVTTRLAAEQPERTVRVAIEPGLVVWCDARLLAIVLENLIGNAWKFTSKRTDALIEVGRLDDDSHLAYFVRDNGAGFDMAHAGRLFGVFQRLHALSEFEGTGIGLATVQRAIHRHRGQVRAEGSVGQGATFYFTLGDGGPEEGTRDGGE